MANDAANPEQQRLKSNNHVGRKAVSCCKSLVENLFYRKPILLLELEFGNNNRLRKSVSALQMLGIGIGGIIGTGIFVLSGQAAAEYAGPSIIISFIIAGIAALLSALSMSEMSTVMSSSEYPAFIIGWLSTLLYQLGSSAVAVRWSHYMVYFIELISNHNATSAVIEAPVAWSDELTTFYTTGQVMNIPSIAIAIAVTLLLIIGIRETVIVNLVLVIIKLIILLIFIFACCAYVDRKNYDSFIPPNGGSFSQYGVTGMLHASTFVFFAYVGFESVTAVAQEAEHPLKSMPFALIGSLVISLLIYVGVCTVMVGLVPYQVLNTTYPLIAAVEATPCSSWLPIVLALGAVASLTTVAITVLLAQSRIFYAMARDGLLPRIFTQICDRTVTPWVSITVCGVICALLSGVFPIDIFGEMASIAALITYIFVHICVIVIPFREENYNPAFRVPFGPWLIPIVGILLCILLLINTTGGTAIRFGVWMGIGHVIYFSYGFWHATRGTERRDHMGITSSKLNEELEHSDAFSNAAREDLVREMMNRPSDEEL